MIRELWFESGVLTYIKARCWCRLAWVPMARQKWLDLGIYG